MTRVRFLEWLVGLLSTAAAGLGLRGAVTVLTPPPGLGERVKGWRRVLGPADLPEDGHAVKVLVDGVPYLIRLQRDTLTAFSAVCPHAGCVVRVSRGAAPIRCACHGSTFDVETGEPNRGPATEPLATVEVRWGRGDVVELHV